MVTNDGVAIAREIHLRDQFENMGAQLVKEAAIKTNDIVGDGTTTATVLAHAIIREGMEAIGGRRQPGAASSGIDLAVGRLVEHLRDVAHPVVTEQDYAGWRVSANDDDTVGAAVGPALHTVGDGGIVTVEESPTHGMSVEFVEGFEYDNGYVSPYGDQPGQPRGGPRRPVHPALREDHQTGAAHAAASARSCEAPRPLVFIAENVEGPAEHAGAQPHERDLPMCGGAGASAGDRRLRKLEDIATITGARFTASTRHSPWRR